MNGTNRKEIIDSFEETITEEIEKVISIASFLEYVEENVLIQIIKTHFSQTQHNIISIQRMIDTLFFHMNNNIIIHMNFSV